MICKKCQTKNITKAQYCRHCGSTFTEEERQKAYDRTVFGVIDKLEKWKGYITLEFITGSPIFKTVVLLAILVWGFFLGRTNGDRMLILESDAYRVQQNVNSGEYYVLTEQDSVSLDLYLPRQAEAVQLQAFIDGTVVLEQSFTGEEQPRLDCGAAEYYHICADYGDSTERITVYVVPE